MWQRAYRIYYYATPNKTAMEQLLVAKTVLSTIDELIARLEVYKG